MAAFNVDTSTSALQQRADESDLDPQAFLKSVRELSEKREREDAERYRALELEIEKSREERAVRRAERARSISPQKRPTIASRSSANASSRSATPPPSINPPSTSTPHTNPDPPSDPSSDVPEFRGFGSSKTPTTTTPSAHRTPQMAQTSDSPSKPPTSATSLARSGTLSWQQRPSSRGASSRPRSMIVSNTISLVKSSDADEPELGREQIAASLGARDPSWFRQTADRGVGNAAFRKNVDETTAGDAFASGRRGLPGMQRETSTTTPRPGSTTPAEAIRSDTPSRSPSVLSSVAPSSNFSTIRTSSSSKPDLKSLIAEDEGQAKASPMMERTIPTISSVASTSTISSPQPRLAGTPDRPASPTKGMGGFVQSAMMKRSDSVNKRWSAQPTADIGRQNSLTSPKGVGSGLAASYSMPRLDPTPSAEEIVSQPTTTSAQDTPSAAYVTNSITNTRSLHSRSKSHASLRDDPPLSPPSTPSKRWSPTKSSWLESAIARPESPKPASPARNSQPNWMTDIAKAKAQRAGGEGGGSRPNSPGKDMLAQGSLHRSESRDLGTPRLLSATPLGQEAPRSASPTKDLIGLGLYTESSGMETPRLLSAAPLGQDAPRPGSPSRDLHGPSSLERSESGGLETTRLLSATPLGQEAPRPSSPSRFSTSAGAANTSRDFSRPPSTQPTRAQSTSSSTSTTKAKPETPPKPQTDFRNTLRPRAQAEAKQEETPEFLSKFGNLRKATTQNYVAPDVLKSNILRGKAELAKTDGPVKTVRRDELKESLVAKKDEWKREKEEGIVRDRPVTLPPVTPQKPEALAKREVLSRAESKQAPLRPDKPKTATPEALQKQKSLTEKTNVNTTLPLLQKQTSAPVSTPVQIHPTLPKKQTSTPLAASTPPAESSKLAARFNPGLAGILARGPPSGPSTPARVESPAPSASQAAFSAPSEPPAEGGQLHDMRKGRAKGPKKRKGGAGLGESATSPPPRELAISKPLPSEPLQFSRAETKEPEQITMAKPRAPPGSAASLMMASLQKPSVPSTPEKPATPAKPRSISGPRPMNGASPTVSQKPASIATATNTPSSANAPAGADIPAKTAIPEFQGFGSVKRSTTRPDDNKENAGSPAVKSAALQWGQSPSAKKAEPPAQIKLPSKKDEEAAMRSAGLLATSSSRPGSSSGLRGSVERDGGAVQMPSASAGGPPKPAKSSRVVSGQVPEPASPTKGTLGWFDEPKSSKAGVDQQLRDVFGSIPQSKDTLTINTQAVLTSSPHQDRVFKTIRKSVQVALPDGSMRDLPQPQEYTFFDESVYICTHAYSIADGHKKTEIFLWTGESSPKPLRAQAESSAKRLAREAGNNNAPVNIISQGLEPPGFLQVLGGILITRRGAHNPAGASKQYMLQGRKHLGQITFDEVPFDPRNLSSGFAHLISYPATLQSVRLYLWKGLAASAEEISAARLAAADLSETQEVIEVDDGAEFASFLKIFGPNTTKSSIPKCADIWRMKATAPHLFATRLFRIQSAEAANGKSGIFSNMFARRPSWGNVSPVRKDNTGGAETATLVAKEISPFTQSDLEAEGVYVLDAYHALYVLVGPVFPTQSEASRNFLLAQSLLFAAEYAVLAAGVAVGGYTRDAAPKGLVLLGGGVPEDLKLLFRHWDERSGLWGMGAGASADGKRKAEVRLLGLQEVVGVVCKA